MAAMPELMSPVADAIEAYYVRLQEPRDDLTLRCSKIGEPCERSLWYSYRWVSPVETHEGRVERLFRTGHREEERMIDDLRAIGVQVVDRDPTTGEQWRVSFLGGVLTGSADGRCVGVPGAEKTEHLLECKTHNEKSFRDWKAKGVAVSKPMHFAQMQIYMHGLGLTRALYVAHNKNTDEVDTERVKYDPVAASQILAKAERVSSSDTAPSKFETFACRWCKHESVCKGEVWARKNCRTCLNAQAGATWSCALTGAALSADEQARGCPRHLFVPSLVPGEQIDADLHALTVTYRLHGGDLWVNGGSDAR